MKQHFREASRLHAWDTWSNNTGIINHLRKYNCLDSANSSITSARQKSKILNKELKDIKEDLYISSSSNISISASKDFWFDNIFTNFSIKGQIDHASNQVDKSIASYRKIINNLNRLKDKYQQTIDEQSTVLKELIKEYK